MKTDILIEKYYRLLREQEPGESALPDVTANPTAKPIAAAPASAETAPDATVEPDNAPVEEMGNNEKYIIKILTNAFIFNPSVFDTHQQRFIKNKIEDIKTSVNVSVSKTVDDLKRILSLDNSLRVESKTMFLLGRYKLLHEQPADATEPQSANTETSRGDQETDKVRDTSNINKLELNEIFPLYKELILQALLHIPTDEELIILKPIVNNFADSDPEKIVTVIKDLLNQESDIDLAGDLAGA